MQYKMKILLNQEKIREEARYDYDDFIATLDRLFVKKLGMIKEAPDVFAGPNRGNDLAQLFRAIGYLKDKDWFMNNVSEWQLLSIDDYHPDWIETEDCKAHYMPGYKETA